MDRRILLNQFNLSVVFFLRIYVLKVIIIIREIIWKT